MKSIEQLGLDLEHVAGSGGVMSEEDKQALAIAFVQAEKEREKILSAPNFGTSLEKVHKAMVLGDTMRSILDIERDILGKGQGTYEEVQLCIETMGTTGWRNRLRNIFSKH